MLCNTWSVFVEGLCTFSNLHLHPSSFLPFPLQHQWRICYNHLMYSLASTLHMSLKCFHWGNLYFYWCSLWERPVMIFKCTHVICSQWFRLQHVPLGTCVCVCRERFLVMESSFLWALLALACRYRNVRHLEYQHGAVREWQRPNRRLYTFPFPAC